MVEQRSSFNYHRVGRARNLRERNLNTKSLLYQLDIETRSPYILYFLKISFPNLRLL